MSNTIILFTHLGLGDNLMCHGIIRAHCLFYDKVITFCKNHNYDSFAFMFRDIKNLEIIKGNDQDAINYINSNQQHNVKVIGFNHLNPNSNKSLDQQFYDIANVNFQSKYSLFKCLERDPQRESDLFDKLVKKSPYIFIHDDSSRNMNIEINTDLPIIRADKKFTSNIFDYCKIIENASEIHVIDSSFFFMIDCLNYHNPNQLLYSHRYLRMHLFESNMEIPHHQKNWNILNDKLEYVK